MYLPIWQITQDELLNFNKLANFVYRPIPNFRYIFFKWQKNIPIKNKYYRPRNIHSLQFMNFNLQILLLSFKYHGPFANDSICFGSHWFGGRGHSYYDGWWQEGEGGFGCIIL